MQYTENFPTVKVTFFQQKIFGIFIMSAQNRDQSHLTEAVLTCLCNMSRVMRKPDFCLGKNKGVDHLHGNIFYNSYCKCRFIKDLAGNLKDQFSRVAAHIM